MRRILSLVVAVVLCVAAACPVFAAEDDFVPSISYKGVPEIVPFDDGNGGSAIASVHNADDEIVGYLYRGCLLLTPVSQAATSNQIPADAAQQLLKIYEDLNSGALKLPFDQIDEELKPEEMVIRDLFDVSWLCTDHPDVVAQEGVYIKVTFDMNVDENTQIYGMVYMNEQTARTRQTPAKQWVPMDSVVNNGDGTVTCTFEDIGAVAFAVHTKTPPVQTGDRIGRSFYLWIGVMTASAVALVAVVTAGRRKNAR